MEAGYSPIATMAAMLRDVPNILHQNNSTLHRANQIQVLPEGNSTEPRHGFPLVVSWRRNRFGRQCRVPLVAAVISEGGYRFDRARKILQRVGFQHVLHMPAVFSDRMKTRESPCKGFNGLRLASRNVWSLIVATNTSMAVFEDDVALHEHLPDSQRDTAVATSIAIAMGICRFIVDSVEPHRADLAYLGYLNTRYVQWGTHALWTSPKAAKLLLRSTTKCYTHAGEGTDNNVVKACRASAEGSAPKLRCSYAYVPGQTAQLMGGRHGFYGFFAQDRRNVSAYLHSKENRPSRLTDVVPKSVWQRDPLHPVGAGSSRL